MAKVGRLHGALLAESEGRFYLVGDLKEPADFAAAGFKDPADLLPLENQFVELEVVGQANLTEPYFTCSLKGEALARKLFHRLVIKRNGSVSSRLWNLIFEAKENAGQTVVDADWLIQMPDEIWEIVQEQVLRCR